MISFHQSAWGASHYARPNDSVSESWHELDWLAVDFGHETACQWDEVLDALFAARLLSDDWDGQGAKAPMPEAVDTALKLALFLKKRGSTPPDDFGPGVNGVIVFGWHSGPLSMVVEVASPRRVEGYRWTQGSERAERFILLPGN